MVVVIATEVKEVVAIALIRTRLVRDVVLVYRHGLTVE